MGSISTNRMPILYFAECGWPVNQTIFPMGWTTLDKINIFRPMIVSMGKKLSAVRPIPPKLISSLRVLPPAGFPLA